MPEYSFEMSTDRLSLGGLAIQGKTFSKMWIILLSISIRVAKCTPYEISIYAPAAARQYASAL